MGPGGAVGPSGGGLPCPGAGRPRCRQADDRPHAQARAPRLRAPARARCDARVLALLRGKGEPGARDRRPWPLAVHPGERAPLGELHAHAGDAAARSPAPRDRLSVPEPGPRPRERAGGRRRHGGLCRRAVGRVDRRGCRAHRRELRAPLRVRSLTLEPGTAPGVCTPDAPERPRLRVQRRCQARAPGDLRPLVRARPRPQPPRGPRGHRPRARAPGRGVPRAGSGTHPDPRAAHQPAGDSQVPALLELPEPGGGASRRPLPLLCRLRDGIDRDLAHAPVRRQGAAARILLCVLSPAGLAGRARRRRAARERSGAADPRQHHPARMERRGHRLHVRQHELRPRRGPCAGVRAPDRSPRCPLHDRAGAAVRRRHRREPDASLRLGARAADPVARDRGYQGPRGGRIQLGRVTPAAQGSRSTHLGAAAAAALPLALAAWVYFPITRAYFYADDFTNLVSIVNDGFLPFVLRPFGGHNLLVRNLAFYGSFRLFGLRADLFFWTVLLTYLLDVWLLFRILRNLTGSLTLACFGAILWGTSPVNDGTLAWYSVYGQVLAATVLLVVLERVTARARAGGTVGGRSAAVWYGLLLLGTVCFGVGVGVALVFPAVLFLLLPETWRQPRIRAAYLALPLVTIVIYFAFRRLYPLVGQMPPEEAYMAGSLPPFRDLAAMTRELLIFSITATFGSFAVFSRGLLPPGASGVIVPLFAAGVLVLLWRGDSGRRRAGVAMLLLAVGV